MARTAETAERYEDMCKIMRELVLFTGKNEQELTVEERNLLSVAYKNVIGSRRAAWRTLNAGVDEGKFDDLVVAYRKQVEGELSDVCLDVLDLLENTLVKNNVKENEARVFYLKGRQLRTATHLITPHRTTPPHHRPFFAHSLLLSSLRASPFLSLSLPLSVSPHSSLAHSAAPHHTVVSEGLRARANSGRSSAQLARPALGAVPSTETSGCCSRECHLPTSRRRSAVQRPMFLASHCSAQSLLPAVPSVLPPSPSLRLCIPPSVFPVRRADDGRLLPLPG